MNANREKDKTKKFSFHKRLKSFSYAWNGIRDIYLNEHNFRIHLVISLLVVISGIFFQISNTEWLFIILNIGLVFCAEAFNTAIENITNIFSPGFNVHAGKIKDIAAGAVLFAAISAAITGILIFAPKIYHLFL
jgi:diacylglycerol kinase